MGEKECEVVIRYLDIDYYEYKMSYMINLIVMLYCDYMLMINGIFRH